MPLLVLLLIALAAGGATYLLAWRYPRRPAGVHEAAPSLEAARAVGAGAGRHPRLRGLLSSRLDPEAATGLALSLALVVVVGGGIALAILVILVRSSHGLIGIDASAANWGDRHATAFSTNALTLVTDLGEAWLVAAAAVVVALTEFMRTKSRWVVPFLLTVVVGDKLLTVMIKGLVDRVRPTLNPVAATLGPAFPSGHASTAAAFWAAAALVAGRWCGRRTRAILVGLAVGIAVAVAASRVLLDVHWLTDVIGGLALGWAWFAASAVAFGGRLLRFGAGVRTATDAAEEQAQTPPSSRGGTAAP